MESLVFGCDINKITSKLASVANKNINHSSATELAQDTIGSAYISYDPTKNSVPFEKFIWVVFRNKLSDKLRLKYKASNQVSLNGEEDIDMVSNQEDLVGMVETQAKELFDSKIINKIEHDIIVLKSHRYENQEIAEKLNLTPGRISQIWKELQEVLGDM